MNGPVKPSIVATVAVLCLFSGLRVARDSAQSRKSEALPRWSCRHEGPPVEDVPLSLVRLAGFRDHAKLREFSDSNRVPLQWTHLSIKAAMVPLENRVRECFRGASSQSSLDIQPLAEVWLTWRLTSDGNKAMADDLQVARTFGRSPYQDLARRCVEEHLLGRMIRTGAQANRPLLVYRGTFPFYRKIQLDGSDPANPAALEN
jgi:hypothetical protein